LILPTQAQNIELLAELLSTLSIKRFIHLVLSSSIFLQASTRNFLARTHLFLRIHVVLWVLLAVEINIKTWDGVMVLAQFLLARFWSCVEKFVFLIIAQPIESLMSFLWFEFFIFLSWWLLRVGWVPSMVFLGVLTICDLNILWLTIFLKFILGIFRLGIFHCFVIMYLT